MSAQNNGGPAFPNVPDGAGSTWSDWDQGMTLRDYFAANVIAELISIGGHGHSFGVNQRETNESFATAAYAVSDAMLKARES